MKHWKRILTAVLSVTFLLPSALAAPAGPTVKLSDIGGHWAKSEINQAVAEGWINGYPDGTFQPDRTVSRSELTKLLLAATGLTPGCETVAWMKEHARVPGGEHGGSLSYVPQALRDMDQNWLTNQGWMDGALYSGLLIPTDYPDRMFRPNQAITRGEIAVLSVRSLGLVYPATQPSKEESSFTDRDAFSEDMAGYIREAANAGVIKGEPGGTFSPDRTATRAEAVTMVARVRAIMEEGSDPALHVRLRTNSYRSSDAPVVRPNDNIRVQMTDQGIYANFRDIMREDDIVREEMDWGFNGPSYEWFPTLQAMRIMEGFASYVYQAGNRSFTHNYPFQNLWITEREDELFYLPFSPRLLRGELMVPVYRFPDDSVFIIYHFTSEYNETEKTITIHVDSPAERRS